MQKHVKAYMECFGYTKGDWIPCEMCGSTAVDIHHIRYRSHGGTDHPSNLAALCRDCHNMAHDVAEYNDRIRVVHNNKYISWRGV